MEDIRHGKRREDSLGISNYYKITQLYDAES
jgi:hypothetical protein